MTERSWLHFPVSGLALVWYLICAADYVMFRLQIPGWVAWFTPDQMDYFQSLPIWVSMGWAIGVWAGLAGAWLLLRQSRAAAVMFALSFIGLMVMALGVVYVTRPSLIEVTGPLGVWILLGAITLAFVFFLFARAFNVRQRLD